MRKKERPEYLQEQIITYIGNKRSLLPQINEVLWRLREQQDGRKLRTGDLFAGSGAVSRLLKQHSEFTVANDLETYSRILSQCYLCNEEDYPRDACAQALVRLEDSLKTPVEGILSANYAPKDDACIQPGERVFYTRSNALRIDTYRAAIAREAAEVQPFLLAPLLYAASVHTNTGGVFKGFYKDSGTGLGKFGGNGENALSRILGTVAVQPPVLSAFSCPAQIYQEDANRLVRHLPPLDLVYLDPPYNQHPYGSNYFMLNVIAENELPGPLSRISGIPEGWNRSVYNKRREAKAALRDLIAQIPARYLLVSYNSEGFIALEEMRDMLSEFGRVQLQQIPYVTYRASRNLSGRSPRLQEYLFLLEKDRYV